MEFNFLIKVIEQNVDFQNSQGVGVGLKGDNFCAVLQLAKIKRVVADIGPYIDEYAALEMLSNQFKFRGFEEFAGVQISLDIVSFVLNEEIGRNICLVRPRNCCNGRIEQATGGKARSFSDMKDDRADLLKECWRFTQLLGQSNSP